MNQPIRFPGLQQQKHVTGVTPKKLTHSSRHLAIERTEQVKLSPREISKTIAMKYSTSSSKVYYKHTVTIEKSPVSKDTFDHENRKYFLLILSNFSFNMELNFN